METRVCSKCGNTTDYPNGFHTRKGTHNKLAGNLYSYCIKCHRLYTHNHYLAHKVEYVAKAQVNSARYFKAAMSWLTDYLYYHHCVDCGEKDIVVLEFDHREPTSKEYNVGTLIHDCGTSLEKLQREVAKCDVRCANCHRRRTAKQYKWRKAFAPVAQPA